jgi:transposase-like protein
MYYGGMSLGEIRRHCEQQYGTFPSRSTLYRWLSKFSRIAINEAKKYTPKVGDIWVADETVLKVEGKKLDRLKKVCGSGT